MESKAKQHSAKQEFQKKLKDSHSNLKRKISIAGVELAWFVFNSDATDPLELRSSFLDLEQHYLLEHLALTSPMVHGAKALFHANGALIEEMATEHGNQFMQATSQLDSYIHALSIGQVVPMQLLLDTGERALSALRAQIRFEQQGLMHWSDERMSEFEWARVLNEASISLDALAANEQKAA